MKPALHRSMTFWSGLLVMAFICWAWWDSSRDYAFASRAGWVLVHGESGICFGRATGRHDSSGRASFPHHSHALAMPSPTFDHVVTEADYERRRKRGGVDPAMRMFGPTAMSYQGDWQLFIPHWLILLALGAPWLGLLLWRVRRRKRHITP